MTHAGPYCLQIDACDLAASSGSEVQHPLLDKVWLCSANSDRAASFFLHLFHPVPHKRIAAVDHAWTASTLSRMYDEMGLNCRTSAAASRWSRIKQSCTGGLCAFLPCFGSRSPTVEAETPLAGSCSHPNSKIWHDDLSCSHVSKRTPSLLNQDLTSQGAAAHTDVPESVQSQAGSMQTAPSKGLTPSPPETPLGHVDMLADICPGTSCRQGPASAHQSCDCHSCARQPPTASSAGLAAGKAIYQQLWSRSFGSNERPR